MTKSKETDLEHLQWIIKSRSDNQRCAVTLFTLLEEYPGRLKKKKYSLAAQALVGITFSLWRAAFLADKKGYKGLARESAKSFLEKVILDNAIAYAQDKAANEWTFNYYVNNARYTLLDLKNRIFPLLVDECKVKGGPAKERWEYYQMLLDKAVTNFGNKLNS